ncbi:hypothetical protein [Rhizorhabdus histidinilytica]|uniref:Uncharacterized protein n=1 Tax=Rhizorhabdus histidinilytica TaxID=439228 RepID=A0A1T5A8B1_9SPHN|nr:hypothetical protein [Rhizorhabdus histidinilytica]SKB31099.1 hypothetical protein SAMN06295920_101689 [Rhizorhabdus histidinilytica]
MNALTNVEQGGAIAVQGGYDPFAAYGAEAANGGTFLKFSKGEWLLGQDNQDVELGRLLVANMNELSIGWIRWEDGKPAERRMNLLTSGIRPDSRAELGYTDQTLWDTDADGKPVDPWNFTNELPLADPETGEQMTFSASSKGGIGCIGNLCKAYAAQRGQHPGLFPVLELARNSYMHPVYKKTYVPVLNIVDWVENGSVPPPVGAVEEDDTLSASATVTETPAATKAAGAKTRF